MGRLAVLLGIQQRCLGRTPGSLLAGRAVVRVSVPRGEHQLQHSHHHGETLGEVASVLHLSASEEWHRAKVQIHRHVERGEEDGADSATRCLNNRRSKIHTIPTRFRTHWQGNPPRHVLSISALVGVPNDINSLERCAAYLGYRPASCVVSLSQSRAPSLCFFVFVAEQILKYGSANILFLAMTICVPLVRVLYCSHVECWDSSR